MPSFFDLQRYAKTGVASADMTAFDKMRALAAFGGGKTQTMTGVPPLSFKADGEPLISWSMKGNGQQQGTPSPDNIITPTFCGKLVGSDWTIPLTNAGQTTPIYLGEVQTVRRIKKLVLTGEEIFNIDTYLRFSIFIGDIKISTSRTRRSYCSHYECLYHAEPYDNDWNNVYYQSGSTLYFHDRRFATVADFKAFLAAQYAAGTPVTIWYVLATPENAIVNEPLAKIGTYADELHSEDAGVTIPTSKGQNTLTVDTDLQPSEMNITYRG